MFATSHYGLRTAYGSWGGSSQYRSAALGGANGGNKGNKAWSRKSSQVRQATQLEGAGGRSAGSVHGVENKTAEFPTPVLQELKQCFTHIGASDPGRGSGGEERICVDFFFFDEAARLPGLDRAGQG